MRKRWRDHESYMWKYSPIYPWINKNKTPMKDFFLTASERWNLWPKISERMPQYSTLRLGGFGRLEAFLWPFLDLLKFFGMYEKFCSLSDVYMLVNWDALKQIRRFSPLCRSVLCRGLIMMKQIVETRSWSVRSSTRHDHDWILILCAQAMGYSKFKSRDCQA